MSNGIQTTDPDFTALHSHLARGKQAFLNIWNTKYRKIL